MPNRRVVFWQHHLTDHMVFTLEALAACRGSSVIAISEARENVERKRQGWTRSSSFVAEIVLSSSDTISVRELCREYRNDIHVFCSLFWRPKILSAFVLISRQGGRIYVVSEPYNIKSSGYFKNGSRVVLKAKALLRPLLYRVFTLLFSARIKGVFCISRLAESQYARMGFDKRSLFPFGYFIRTAGLVPRISLSTGPLRVIFVGSLTPRKGADLLIKAVKQANKDHDYVVAEYYGPGDPADFEFDQVCNLYKGTIEFGKSQEVIRDFDLVAIPSRHDGWGVVVNEAVDAGTPIICSVHAGASTIVEEFGVGLVVDPDDTDQFAATLVGLSTNRHALQAMRDCIPAAKDALAPEAGARYMEEVFEGRLNGSSGTAMVSDR